MIRSSGRIVCLTFLFFGIKSTIPMDPPPSSNCPDCKSVSGSGPLAGEYFLVEGKNQESLCLNNCVYMKKGDDDEDWYCFIKQDGPYTTTDCEKILPSTVAPFMKVFSNMIEENGEVIEQVDQYNNMTGEVSIKVPPHGNREPLQILMDPNKDKIVSSTLSKCQIKSLPDEVDPRSLASSEDEVDSSDEAITESNEVIRYGITLEKGEASQEDLNNLSSTAKTACEGKKIVLTEEKTVNEEVFKNLINGGIIDIGPDKLRRKRDFQDGNCSTKTRMCAERTSDCWRWTHGIHFSIHHLNLDILCVECCNDEAETTTPGPECICGVKRTSSRIVGGTEIEVNKYPWMALIATSNSSQSFFCGGTLIAAQWVLTAVHCMFKDSAETQPYTAAELKVVLGEHDIASSSESQIPRKVIQVSRIITHPNYSVPTTLNNDIALLKLTEEVDLNIYTPSCIAATSDNFEGQRAWVYGWGSTSFGGPTSDKLLEVDLPVVSNIVCNAALPFDITDDMLCAGGELNKDACQADSGGPLTVEASGRHHLIGIVSHGNGCGQACQYGVFADVAYFRSWIDTTISVNGGATYCSGQTTTPKPILGDSTSQLCPCSSITTLQKLEQCTKLDNGICPDGFYSCEGQCKVEVGSPTAKCDGSCPNSRLSCGDLCIPSAWNSKLYDNYKQWIDCNGQCIRGNTPCSGLCPVGKTACGDKCVLDEHVSRWYRLCDDICITNNMPCNGTCNEGRVICGDQCITDDKNWRDCNGKCIYKTQACEGMCPLGSSPCGDRCITDDASLRDCNGKCIYKTQACEGMCPLGSSLCGDQCITDDASWRDCNGKCIYKTQACEGMCPLGSSLCGDSAHCITNGEQNFKVCNGKCIDFNYPCNGECPDRQVLFWNEFNESSCIWDDDKTYKCGNSRLYRYKKCNESCSKGWIPCDFTYQDHYSLYNYYDDDYKAPECKQNGSNEYSGNSECNGKCIQSDYTCDGECPIGTYNCNDYCMPNYYYCHGKCQIGWEPCGSARRYCMKNNSLDNVYRSCGYKCVRQDETCNGQCASGMNVCGPIKHQGSESYCYTPNSVYQPCNGICLTNGTSCGGRCKNGFLPCTLGYTQFDNEQVCYNDSEQSLFYLFNGYCWFKDRYFGYL